MQFMGWEMLAYVGLYITKQARDSEDSLGGMPSNHQGYWFWASVVLVLGYYTGTSRMHWSPVTTLHQPIFQKGSVPFEGVLDYELLVCPKGGQNSRHRFQREMGHSDPQVKLVAKMKCAAQCQQPLL